MDGRLGFNGILSTQVAAYGRIFGSALWNCKLESQANESQSCWHEGESIQM